MDQDQKKSAAAEAALGYVEVGDVVGVGTKATAGGDGGGNGVPNEGVARAKSVPEAGQPWRTPRLKLILMWEVPKK